MRLSLLFFYLFSLTTLAQDFNYLPSGHTDHTIITYEEFSLSYNEVHRQPNWVAYELTAEELAQSMDRRNYFAKDRNTAYSATLSDYKYSGYDRGHLCRAMYCKTSRSAYRESF